jgi:hypothetical protein
MTSECWNHQKGRLIDRFGPRNFSSEFSLLVAIECRDLPDSVFVDIVNAMIGARKPMDPPLMRDFRDARLSFERRRYERDLYGAIQALDQPAKHVGLKGYLAKEFPGCKTINEAVAVRALQIKIKKAENPNYDPMVDEKWMGPEGAA